MREIEYRGKREDNGKWIYGSYVEGGAILETGFCMSEIELGVISVIPETVGQFTGLKDKKGVKIFEGDIVDYFKADGKPYRGFIKYYEDGFDIRREGTIDCSLRGISSRCIEVIGNIHDNQELLKEARNDIY